jgi:hypothetical protein
MKIARMGHVAGTARPIGHRSGSHARIRDVPGAGATAFAAGRWPSEKGVCRSACYQGQAGTDGLGSTPAPPLLLGSLMTAGGGLLGVVVWVVFVY